LLLAKRLAAKPSPFPPKRKNKIDSLPENYGASVLRMNLSAAKQPVSNFDLQWYWLLASTQACPLRWSISRSPLNNIDASCTAKKLKVFLFANLISSVALCRIT